MYTTVINIIFEQGISFLIILKLFEFSGFQKKFKKLTEIKKMKKLTLLK